MKFIAALALSAGLGLAAVAATPTSAEAGHRGFSLHLGHGGFGLHIGPRYKYRRYRPYPYYGYYGPRRYYAPRRYGRCSHKARLCARNWGWHNNNWRGCMRYYGCR